MNTVSELSEAVAEAVAEPVSAAVPCARITEQLKPAILATLGLTILTGCVFPLFLYAIARPVFPNQVQGSLIMRDGVVVGSKLIGQLFTKPEYFQSRPSAAGRGYDGTASGGTNLGPNNPQLTHGSANFTGIWQLAEEYRKRNALSPEAAVPIDAVTRSGSGLDPHISPENAELQVPRVAHTRGLSEEVVRQLVAEHTEGAQLGFLGRPRVSVLELNLALDQLNQAAYTVR
jgi:K+-transporting ATPase ATPase C chain